MKRIPLALALVTLAWPFDCPAYELSTHGALTLEAYGRSLIARDPRLGEDLGFDANAENPFDGLRGPAYWDASSDRFFPRQAIAFDPSRMPPSINDHHSLSVAGWLPRCAS